MLIQRDSYNYARYQQRYTESFRKAKVSLQITIALIRDVLQKDHELKVLPRKESLQQPVQQQSAWNTFMRPMLFGATTTAALAAFYAGSKSK